MKTLLIALIVAGVGLLAGCVAVPTRHGLVVAPIIPAVGVGVGVGYGYGYGPYHHYYR
jgi:hypothetical protein